MNPRVPESYITGALHEAFRRAEARDRLRHSEAAVLMVVEDAGGALSRSFGARRRR